MVCLDGWGVDGVNVVKITRLGVLLGSFVVLEGHRGCALVVAPSRHEDL